MESVSLLGAGGVNGYFFRELSPLEYAYDKEGETVSEKDCQENPCVR